LKSNPRSLDVSPPADRHETKQPLSLNRRIPQKVLCGTMCESCWSRRD